MSGKRYFEDLKAIFRAAVERVDPYHMIRNHVRLEGDLLRVTVEQATLDISLGGFDRVLVIGAGKATAKMARAIEEIMGERITRGVISVKYAHVESLQRIIVMEAAHPVPDENGVAAAKRVMELAEMADERTLVITLISGGGSALLPFPFEGVVGPEQIRVTLDDKQTVTKALLECGATIGEINCIRKHISNIKGGKLARAIYPATSVNFILSDVVGDRLDTIASGPTSPDDTTFSDASRIIEKYDIGEKVPLEVMKVIRYGVEGRIPETPKPNDPVFGRVHNVLIGTNYASLLAAAHKAEELGYHTTVMSSQIIGEAREVAKVFVGVARDVKERDLLARKPACLIAGGETTVTIRGGGKGGRNQEMALSFLAELRNDRVNSRGIYFLSASTDGNDGPTDAAGAFAANDVVDAAVSLSLEIDDYLKRNDSYHFYDTIGYLLKTGPTNTNVCDLQIVLVVPEENA